MPVRSGGGGTTGRAGSVPSFAIDGDVPCVPASGIVDPVRACTPGPGAWTTFEGERFKLGPVTIEANPEPLAPGELEVQKNAVLVGTGSMPVRLGEVKAFGKKQMAAADWARGVRVASGARFGADG